MLSGGSGGSTTDTVDTQVRGAAADDAAATAAPAAPQQNSAREDSAREDSTQQDSTQQDSAQKVSTPRVIGDPELARLIAAQEDITRQLAAYGTKHLNTADRLALLVRDEAVTRSRLGRSYVWLNELLEQHGFDQVGARKADALSQILNIDRSAATRRIAEAADLGDRTTLAGDPLAPVLPTTAKQLRRGVIDHAHVVVIRKFLKTLPAAVDAGVRADAERHLATAAEELKPSELSMVAERIGAHIVEEGEFELPPERVRKRGIFPDKQGRDGMVSGRFVLDAETWSYAEAIASKLAKPGMCNPDDPAPVVDAPDSDAPDGDATGGDAPDGDETEGGSPEDDGSDGDGDATGDGDTAEPAARPRDLRTRPQRLHDAFKTLLRQMLASGTLGQHRGLPVTVIVTTTLADLERGAGLATTATGGILPIRDVIRMGSHARHYLAIYDDAGCPLNLGRSKRIADENQRIVLIGSDRGCSAPGCERPATMSQVHHMDEWKDGGTTDIGRLTFACDRHHPMVNDGPLGWATSTVPPGQPYEGRTQWHPPAIIDPQRRGRVNHYHHAQEYLCADDGTPMP